MWIADNWKDYEVLDAAGGEKLERWGDYILIRPDPQVIWSTPRAHRGWERPNGHYHRSDRGGGEWEFFRLPDEWGISYRFRESGGEAARKPLSFRLKPFSFKHTGLFPEQAVNWEWFSHILRSAPKPPDRPLKVLNLFAYTGGATLAAAAAGAHVTHVDASKGMVDDCAKFVEREIRRGNRYDGIIMDPPSYGRGPKGEIWKLEVNIWPFLTLAAQLLSHDALFFLLNSYTTGLQPAVLSYMLSEAVAKGRGGRVEAQEVGLPVSANGLVLPCGAAGRWQRD